MINFCLIYCFCSFQLVIIQLSKYQHFCLQTILSLYTKLAMDSSVKITDYYQFISYKGYPCNLGFGAYGSVQLAKCLKAKKTVAIKKIYQKLAINQVYIHKAMDHPNIIKLLDFFFDDQNNHTYLVLQYAQNGTLFDFIKQRGLKDKRLIKDIFKSVCEAVCYMHKNNIMHRDLKPENILFDHQYTVKLCDFGFAASMEPRLTLCGTPEYMSPEMIIRARHTHKIDIWSLGILLFELIEGHAPFEGTNQQQILQKMKKPIYFSKNFTNEQINIIHRTLRVDPFQRPQVDQILAYSWFNGIKRGSKQTSKRSTTDEQNQKQKQKIKILNVKQIPSYQVNPEINQKKLIFNPKLRQKSLDLFQKDNTLKQSRGNQFQKNHIFLPKGEKISLKKVRRS